MNSSESAADGSQFASVVSAGARVAVDSPESAAGFWPIANAISGFLIAVVPNTASGDLSRLLAAMWPLLGRGAVEIRWVAASGTVRCYLLFRCTDEDANIATSAVDRLMASSILLAQELLPGWTLEPLDTESLPVAVNPCVPAESGDLLRHEQGVTLAGGREVDVPALLGVDASELGLLVEMMAKAKWPVVLSLAAAPVEIDDAERSVLLGELADLEKAIAQFSLPNELLSDSPVKDPSSSIVSAAETLRGRVLATERLGFLRISLSSAGPLSDTLIAAAQDSLAGQALALEWVPACEKDDRQVCESNINALGFVPWGIQANEQPGHESVNDCYLASLGEILSELVVPTPDGFLPLDHELIDPAPRPAPRRLPDSGRVLGRSLVDGRVVALSHADRMRHTYVVGQTGTGKSTLLLNLAVQDIEDGKGVCVIDPHGDLIDAILDRYPRSRADDLILFDPSDTERPLPLNLLDARNELEQDFVVQQMVGMLYRIYDPTHSGIVGPRFENMFRNAALVAMAHPDGGTLLDIARLFTDDTFLAGRLVHTTDPAVRSFWINEMGQTSDFHKSEVLGWFTSKFGAFVSNRYMRAVLGQRKSAFAMREVMDEGKVLLVKLPRGVLGETNALWLGLIFVVKLQMATLARSAVPQAQRREFNLYIDEFQNFAMTDFDMLIAEARKYGLALTLAHQHVGQLTPQLRAAVFGNVASWVMFRLGLSDASMAAAELDNYSAHDLTRLSNYRCVVRTSVDGQVLAPFDVRTEAPSTVVNTSEERNALTTLARLKYGRQIDLVEAEYLHSWGVAVDEPDEADETETEAVTWKEPVPDPDRGSISAADSSLGIPVFGEPSELKQARVEILRLLTGEELDEALRVFRDVFIKTDYSPDCWTLLSEMEPSFQTQDAQEKLAAMRTALEEMADGRLAS